MVNAMYEQSIIERFEKEFEKCKSRDQVNKLYRQARIWCRIHHFFSGGIGCTYERYRELNQRFKTMRWNRLAKLEGNWVVGG